MGSFTLEIRCVLLFYSWTTCQSFQIEIHSLQPNQTTMAAPSKTAYLFKKPTLLPCEHGLYMTVWNYSPVEREFLLNDTRGGWPHVTLIHTGTSVGTEELIDMGAFASHILVSMPLFLDRAFVASRVEDGKTVYDVRMGLDPESEKRIKDAQAQLLAKYWIGDREPKPFMHDTPHIVYQCNILREDYAKRTAEDMDMLLKQKEHSVVVNGVIYM